MGLNSVKDKRQGHYQGTLIVDLFQQEVPHRSVIAAQAMLRKDAAK
jgi:hypothetical protein